MYQSHTVVELWGQKCKPKSLKHEINNQVGGFRTEQINVTTGLPTPA